MLLWKYFLLKFCLSLISLFSHAGAAGSPDWQRCDAVAKVIAKCPSQATSVEDYYKMLSPQVS